MFTTSIFTLALAVCVFAVRSPPAVVTSCSVPGTAALTFDDGPSVYLKEASDMLNAAGANGTFFLNGDNYLSRYPDDCIYHLGPANRVKYAYDAGHQIASHTWSHFHLTKLNRTQIEAQFARVEWAIQRITGALPAFTRPPYGEYNTLVRQVASARSQTLVNWDFDSGDAIGYSSARSERGYDRLVASQPKSILALNHDVRGTSVHVVLPHAIYVLQKAGYKLVTLAECLGKPPYLAVGSPSPRNVGWWLPPGALC